MEELIALQIPTSISRTDHTLSRIEGDHLKNSAGVATGVLGQKDYMKLSPNSDTTLKLRENQGSSRHSQESTLRQKRLPSPCQYLRRQLVSSRTLLTRTAAAPPHCALPQEPKLEQGRQGTIICETWTGVQSGRWASRRKWQERQWGSALDARLAQEHLLRPGVVLGTLSLSLACRVVGAAARRQLS